jgi:predicted nuclease with TOPRIM domain
MFDMFGPSKFWDRPRAMDINTKSPWPAATVAQETKLTEQEARHASHLQEIGERVSQLEQERDKEKEKRKALEAQSAKFVLFVRWRWDIYIFSML